MRGVRALLLKTAPGKFSKSGKFSCFRLKSATGRATGCKMRGITKRLTSRVFSKGTVPTGPAAWRGTAWRGKGGGLRRGKAVDAQVSRLANLSESKRGGAKMLKFTRLAFAALKYHDLVPIGSQRVVLDAAKRLGTAVDVVCTRRTNEVVLVELKCGFAGLRTAAVSPAANLNGPLTKATDCILHRHFAQLAATTALFLAERGTLRALKTKGVEKIGAVLLYVNDDATVKYELPDWWRRRGAKILSSIA